MAARAIWAVVRAGLGPVRALFAAAAFAGPAVRAGVLPGGLAITIGV